jgi:hypothetical protein
MDQKKLFVSILAVESETMWWEEDCKEQRVTYEVTKIPDCTGITNAFTLSNIEVDIRRVGQEGPGMDDCPLSLLEDMGGIKRRTGSSNRPSVIWWAKRLKNKPGSPRFF